MGRTSVTHSFAESIQVNSLHAKRRTPVVHPNRRLTPSSDNILILCHITSRVASMLLQKIRLINKARVPRGARRKKCVVRIFHRRNAGLGSGPNPKSNAAQSTKPKAN